MNKRLALALVVLMFGTTVVFAQHDHSAASAQANAHEGQADPMQECQKHHAESAAALDEAATTLSRAEQLTDPEQVKAAIESAQKSIAEAKHHLGMCPMVQGEMTTKGAMDHTQHKMKCMSKDSQ